MIPRHQIEQSIVRRGRYAKKYLSEQVAFTDGLAKLRNYMLQKAPSPESLPFLLVPWSEELTSLFSFMARCRMEDDFSCPTCFERNECLRKTMLKVETFAKKATGSVYSIDEILQDEECEGFQRMDLYGREAVILLRKIIANLATK